MTINKDSLDFLTALGQNNNREWFNNNKERYQAAHQNIVAFADALILGMNKHDQIETPTVRAAMSSGESRCWLSIAAC